jgi:membrane protease YdiL (CAAX protease family)
LWIYPRMQELDDTSLIYALLNIALRMLIWVVPVFLYLRYIDRVNPLEYLKLKHYWKRGVLVGLALSLLNFFGMLLRFGLPHFSLHAITWNSLLSTSFLIGFFEEIPFRGFIFQKLQERWSFWTANLCSSLLFLAIHLPGWLSLHLLSASEAISVFLLGIIFAAAFYYSKSLWAAIITHSLNDFLSSILFHL